MLGVSRMMGRCLFMGLDW